MHKTRLSVLITANLLLSACQPPASTHTSDTSDSAQTSQTATPTLIEARTAKELTTSIIELSEGRLRDQLICSKLSDTMHAVGHNSKIADIHTVQRQLKTCLPTVDNIQTLQWLREYQAMYRRFLGSNREWGGDAFFNLMDSIAQGKTITVAQLRRVNPRIRYLVGLVRSRADVSVQYLGEGIYVFAHDLQAMADIFLPYLPDAQAEFIKRMAVDNQDIFWNDAAIAVPFDEVVERASFWEDYIRRYSKSYFANDAKQLFAMYRYVLFFGSDNTQWLEDTYREFIDPEYKRQLVLLSKRRDSILAKDAQQLFAFINLSAAKRQQSYPISPTDIDDYAPSDWQISHDQLQQALSIPSPWENHYNRDCLSGIVCTDPNIKS